MPELPEVETFRKFFEQTSLKKKIVETRLYAPEMLKECSESGFIQFTEGYKFISTSRHGKYLFAGISSKKFLVLHFGMTGDLIYYKMPQDAPRHIRLEFRFSNGYHLAYDNMRKFGLIALTDDPAEFIKKKNLGIDPLNSKLTFSEFMKITANRKGTVKSLLLDQSVFVGIGNLYSDEAAFRAGIHPSAQFGALSETKKKNIYREMFVVLKIAVRREGNLPAGYLMNHRKEGEKCPQCGGRITHSTIAGRTSYFCRSHQKM